MKPVRSLLQVIEKILLKYLLNISGRPDRFSDGTRVKREVLLKPVRSFPQVIEKILLNHIQNGNLQLK